VAERKNYGEDSEEIKRKKGFGEWI